MDNDVKENLIEIAQAILLSAVVVATAWCSYQAGLWSGKQSFSIANSYSIGRIATEKQLVAENVRTVDSISVLNFATAVIEKRHDIANFHLQHVRPELRELFEAWLATDPLENPDAPPHPLAMPQYTEEIALSYTKEAEQMRQDAELKMEDAHHAKRISSDYVFMTVLFSIVLFIGGILSKITSLKIQVFLLSLDYVVAIVTFVWLLQLPLGQM